MSTWFITGTSRGFGRLLVAAALEAGENVVATARRPEGVAGAFSDAGDRLSVQALDVGDEEQAASAVENAVRRFGGVDVVVNNAGYGVFGAIEEVSDAEVRSIFDANVFGVLNVTRAVLPTLRAQGSGHIVNIGSSAGIAVGAGRGIYGATKFAVEAISEALRAELAPLGIKVSVVEPGSFRTDFLAHHEQRRPRTSDDAYTETVGALQHAIDGLEGKQPGDPGKAVAAIRALAAADDPPLRLPLGSDSVALMAQKAASLAETAEAERTRAAATDFARI
ncbi:SDR family NAD(P)-dependent oxidoreductase [Mycobacterium yunnanensis]|uniref:SDR family NAD(P)-dependent oxidoreductase n=1 Tax=Mycobacterium yunnanensis TaxID=368477 RepID=A0A9X2Z7D4_9MYCO|nr:SDR family NAD(P)-dependent oxidoreductase [Mycobacterium yunnanensis]MCV7424465.1 SDR family NAD(P)-dependent oxidoreductase [Mycobacterium yunnanensis]